MSDAEMQRDGTLMIGGGGKSEINGKPVENSTYLSKKSLLCDKNRILFLQKIS